MGPPGAPFRLGPGAKCPSCPPPPVGGPGRDHSTSIKCTETSWSIVHDIKSQ